MMFARQHLRAHRSAGDRARAALIAPSGQQGVETTSAIEFGDHAVARQRDGLVHGVRFARMHFNVDARRQWRQAASANAEARNLRFPCAWRP